MIQFAGQARYVHMAELIAAVSLDPLLIQFREDPYPLYRHLLANAPVQWNEQLEAWTIARFVDVVNSLTDARFSTAPGPRHPPAESEGGRVGKSMLRSDPPDHTRLRALVAAAFTPRMVDQLRPRIRAVVAQLLEDMAERGTPVDLMADFAHPLPVAVIAELLGIPHADRSQFLEWSAVVAASLDPFVPAELLQRVVVARNALHAYLREVIAARRRRPGSDLISALVAVEEHGDALSEPELVEMCALLLIAGHSTATCLIGNGMLALLRHGDQLERLRDDPGLLPGAIEELLRFDAPVQLTRRIATVRLEIDGHTIAPGESILPLLGAANHDPAQFFEPERLDLGRHPNPHLAFGRGLHFCLGAPLARVEGQLAIGALLRRFPKLRLAGEPVRSQQVTLRGLQSLPVEVA